MLGTPRRRVPKNNDFLTRHEARLRARCFDYSSSIALGHDVPAVQASPAIFLCRTGCRYRRNMIGSVNSHGGLSVANLLTLFGANSSSVRGRTATTAGSLCPCSLNSRIALKFACFRSLMDCPRSRRRRSRDRLRVKQRLGLDDDRSWILLSESNRVVWPGPDLRTPFDTADGYYGPLPPALFEAVKGGFVALARGGSHVSVPRSE